MAVDTLVVEGAEVRKETGVGTVLEIDRRERNIGFKIQSDNQAVRDPVTGWLDTFGLGEGAHPQFAKGQRVRYEIHVRRKDGVDPATRLADLGPRQKVREVVLLQPLEAEDAPADRPADTPAREAPPGPGVVPAADAVAVASTLVAHAGLWVADRGELSKRLAKASEVLLSIAAELRDSA